MKLRAAGLALVTLLVSFCSLRAQTISWTGSGGNGNVFSSGNWGAGTYLGDGSQSLNFGPAGIATVEITTSSVANINFASPRAAYTFTGAGAGQVLTIDGFVGVNNDANAVSFDNTFGLSLTAGVHNFYVSGTAEFSISSAIAGAGTISKDDTGTLYLAGIRNSTGGTIVNNGTLAISGSVTHTSANTILNGGTLFIDGGSLTNSTGHLGILSTDVGTAILTGGTWHNNAYLYVGEAGVGSLTLNSGSTVTNYATSIGNNVGGTGNIYLNTATSTLNTTTGLYVGSEGTGYLNASNGAQVTSVLGSIGNNAGGVGSATIDGIGTKWTNTGSLFAGGDGNGSLTVSSGGWVTSQDATIGSTSTGIATVTGTDSKWDNAGNFFVGADGNGSLNITAGGLVTSLNMTVGNNTNGIGALAVSGSGSSLAVNGTLRVGWDGHGTLEVQNGAVVTSASAVLGENFGANGSVLVHGSGSTLTISGSDLYVGNGGDGILYLYDQGKINVGGGTGTVHLGHSGPNGAGILNLGSDGTSFFSGGTVNASTITTDAGLSGELKFATNATAINPYYLTTDGLSNGAPVLISGNTEVQQLNGFTVLKSANTHTGATYVSGGTLIVSDTNALGQNTNPVTVNGGTLVVNGISLYNPLTLTSGTLAGSGLVAADTIIGTNVTLSPGLPANGGRIGSLNFAHLELASTGTMEWNLQDPNGSAGTDWDKVNVTTTTTLAITATTGSRFTLKLISLDISGGLGTATGFIPGHTYNWLVFDSDNTQGFDPAKFDLDFSQLFTDSIDIANITLTNTGNDLYLNFTPVPEPSTYALMALGLAGTGLAAWRRKRRRI